MEAELAPLRLQASQAQAGPRHECSRFSASGPHTPTEYAIKWLVLTSKQCLTGLPGGTRGHRFYEFGVEELPVKGWSGADRC